MGFYNSVIKTKNSHSSELITNINDSDEKSSQNLNEAAVFFNAHSETNDEQQLTSLDQSASAGNDLISTKVIKFCARFFPPLLTKLFNQCI